MLLTLISDFFDGSVKTECALDDTLKNDVDGKTAVEGDGILIAGLLSVNTSKIFPLPLAPIPTGSNLPVTTLKCVYSLNMVLKIGILPSRPSGNSLIWKVPTLPSETNSEPGNCSPFRV